MDSIHSIIPFLLYTKPDTSHAIFTLLIIIVMNYSKSIIYHLKSLNLYKYNKIFIEGQRIKHDYKYSPAYLINLVYSASGGEDFLNRLTT